MKDTNLQLVISMFEAIQKWFQQLKEAIKNLVSIFDRYFFISEVKFKTLNKIKVNTRKQNNNEFHSVRPHPIRGRGRRDHRRQHR